MCIVFLLRNISKFTIVHINMVFFQRQAFQFCSKFSFRKIKKFISIFYLYLHLSSVEFHTQNVGVNSRRRSYGFFGTDISELQLAELSFTKYFQPLASIRQFLICLYICSNFALRFPCLKPFYDIFLIFSSIQDRPFWDGSPPPHPHLVQLYFI